MSQFVQFLKYGILFYCIPYMGLKLTFSTVSPSFRPPSWAAKLFPIISLTKNLHPNTIPYSEKEPTKNYKMYSRLLLSRSRRDPLKYFEISILRHIRCAKLRKIPIKQPNFTNERLLELEIYVENIVENGRNCSSGAISPLIHNILLPDVRFLC